MPLRSFLKIISTEGLFSIYSTSFGEHQIADTVISHTALTWRAVLHFCTAYSETFLFPVSLLSINNQNGADQTSGSQRSLENYQNKTYQVTGSVCVYVIGKPPNITDRAVFAEVMGMSPPQTRFFPRLL